MAMVFLTDRKLNNSNINDNNNKSQNIKENKLNNSSILNNNIENTTTYPKIKAPFNTLSKGHDYIERVNKNPGPGAYNIENDILKPPINALENMNFMVNTPRFIENKSQIKSPGPGSYNISDKPLFQRKIFNNPNSKINNSNNTYKYNSINSVSSIPSKNHNYGYLENEDGELIQAIVPVSEDYFSGEKNNSVGPGRYYIYYQDNNPIVKWNKMSSRALDTVLEKKIEKEKKMKNESMYSVNSDLSKVDTDISFAHNTRENKFEYKKFTTKNLMDKYKKNLNSSNANIRYNKPKDEDDKFDIDKELEFLNSYDNKDQKGSLISYNYNQVRYYYKPADQQFFGSTVDRGVTHMPFNEKILYPGPGAYFNQTYKNFEARKKLKKNNSTFAKSKRLDLLSKNSSPDLGPGSYNVNMIDPYQKKSFNKFGNFSCEKRFPEIIKDSDKNNNEVNKSANTNNYEIGKLLKKDLEQKKKKQMFVNVEKELKKNKIKKLKEVRPDFNKYQNSKMIDIIQTNVKSKINPYSSKHNPFLSGLGRFGVESESEFNPNLGPGRYNLSKNILKDFNKSTVIAPFNSSQEKDNLHGSYIQKSNHKISPQDYQKDSYFDWNKKSFNIMFV